MAIRPAAAPNGTRPIPTHAVTETFVQAIPSDGWAIWVAAKVQVGTKVKVGVGVIKKAWLVWCGLAVRMLLDVRILGNS